jgi:small subunit ribosomal protein S20
MRQNARRRARNRWRKGLIKDAVREFEQALGSDRQKAAEQLNVVFSRLDKVAAKGTIHKNAAARKKSRLARRLAKLVAQA